MLRIGLIGDYDETVTAHGLIPRALELAAASTKHRIAAEWLPTERITRPEGEPAGADPLDRFDGLWSVPGSPYTDMDGALWGIRFARERGRPFLGTCGGFQHAIIEYARNVVGLRDADHAEDNPRAALPIVGRLACELIDTVDGVSLVGGSRIAHIYGTRRITEQYNCRFGLDPRFESFLEGGTLRITGRGSNGEARALELDDHPFFLATLFQPERSAALDRVHPLIEAFLNAIAEVAVQRSKSGERERPPA